MMEYEEITLEEIADEIITRSFEHPRQKNYNNLILSRHQMYRRLNNEMLMENIDDLNGRHGSYGRALNKSRRDLNSIEGVRKKPHKIGINKHHQDPGFMQLEYKEQSITREEYYRRSNNAG